MEYLFTLEEIDRVAEDFWQKTHPAHLFAFHGNLGAGKTTFIKALCKAKGVKDVVSSPTFSLINQYLLRDKNGGEKTLYHLDLYRIKDEEEAVQAGIEDCLYSGDVCLVEWPEKIPGLLPDDTLHVYLNPMGKDRKLSWQNK